MAKYGERDKFIDRDEVIEDVILNSGFKKSYIANKIGLDVGQLSRRLHGFIRFNFNEVNEIAKLTNVEDADALMDKLELRRNLCDTFKK